MPKVVAIIQARMGSTRLPGKMMMQILGKPIIAHVFDRVKQAKNLSAVWLATTTDPADDVLADWAKKNNVPVYRGSVNDVCDRYYQTAKLSEAEVVVRVTGDCPLADPAVIDQVVGKYLKGGFEYVCNTQPPTFPDGLDTEVFAFTTLEKAWREAKLASEREHVTPYIWKHPEIFSIKNIIHSPDLSVERWTLDTPEDFVFLEKVITAINNDVLAGLDKILSHIQTHPEWRAINSNSQRNEGYTKSLKDDSVIN